MPTAIKVAHGEDGLGGSESHSGICAVLMR